MTTKRTTSAPKPLAAPASVPVQLPLLDLADRPPRTATAPATEPTEAEVPQHYFSRTPGAIVPCGWCGTHTVIPARGRPPKWCSATCRHRAWEQRRAAESGLAAVEIVERIVEKVVVEKVTQAVEVPAPHPQTAAEFAEVLSDLAIRLDTGRIYDRDLRTIETAAVPLLDALRRRIVRRR